VKIEKIRDKLFCKKEIFIGLPQNNSFCSTEMIKRIRPQFLEPLGKHTKISPLFDVEEMFNQETKSGNISSMTMDELHLHLKNLSIEKKSKKN
jgi:hypothetical protein